MTPQVEEMIEKNKRLVYSIANSIYSKNKLFSKEDLIQVGFLALCKNGHKYDESRGKVSTFITHCVRNDMLKFIKSQKLQGELLYSDSDHLAYDHNIMPNIYDTVCAKSPIEKRIVDLKASGLKNKAIAVMLNVSPNKISKILSTLKSRMDKQNNA